MTVPRNCGRFFLFFPLFLSVTCFVFEASAGKLSALRDKTRGSNTTSKTKPTASAPRSSSSNDDDSDSDVGSKVIGTLASVVGEVRREKKTESSSPRPQSRPRPSRQRDRRPTRSHRRSHHPRGLFMQLNSSPRVPTTIIEEHHYHVPPEPILVAPNAPEPICYEPVEYIQPTTTLAQPVVPEPTIICEEVAPPILVEEIGDTLNPWYGRFDIDYAAEDEDVSRMGFGLLVGVSGGVGLDAGMRLFRERDVDFRDHLWFGDFNVTYEILPAEWIRTRAGIGVNFLADRIGGEAGFNMTVGSDLLMGPVTLSGEVDFGTLGDADLFHGRATLGLRQGDHAEWFAGYDHLDVGGVEMGGVVAGIRFRW